MKLQLLAMLDDIMVELRKQDCLRSESNIYQIYKAVEHSPEYLETLKLGLLVLCKQNNILFNQLLDIQKNSFNPLFYTEEK